MFLNGCYIYVPNDDVLKLAPKHHRFITAVCIIPRNVGRADISANNS